MDRDIISAKTRQAFRENMVGWVLREITDAFDAARIGCDLQFTPNVTGQRRTLVEQYYHTVTWTDAAQVRQLLEVYESVLQRQEALLEGISESDGKRARDELKKLVWLLEKDGFKWAGGSIVATSGSPYLSDIKKAAVVFDAKHLSDQIRRMEESIEKDPDLAIGTSKGIDRNDLQDDPGGAREDRRRQPGHVHPDQGDHEGAQAGAGGYPGNGPRG